MSDDIPAKSSVKELISPRAAEIESRTPGKSKAAMSAPNSPRKVSPKAPRF